MVKMLAEINKTDCFPNVDSVYQALLSRHVGPSTMHYESMDFDQIFGMIEKSFEPLDKVYANEVKSILGRTEFTR